MAPGQLAEHGCIGERQRGPQLLGRGIVLKRSIGRRIPGRGQGGGSRQRTLEPSGRRIDVKAGMIEGAREEMRAKRKYIGAREPESRFEFGLNPLPAPAL